MNIFMMLSIEGATVATPAYVSSVTVTRLNAGACVAGGSLGPVASPSASINVGWTASGFDASVHRYKVYENGVLKTTGTAAVYQTTFANYTESGTFAQFTSDLTYRIDLVTLAGEVLSSMSSAPWVRVYGRCSGGPGGQT